VPAVPPVPVPPLVPPVPAVPPVRQLCRCHWCTRPPHFRRETHSAMQNLASQTLHQMNAKRLAYFVVIHPRKKFVGRVRLGAACIGA